MNIAGAKHKMIINFPSINNNSISEHHVNTKTSYLALIMIQSFKKLCQITRKLFNIWGLKMPLNIGNYMIIRNSFREPAKVRWFWAVLNIWIQNQLVIYGFCFFYLEIHKFCPFAFLLLEHYLVAIFLFLLYLCVTIAYFYTGSFVIFST